MSFSCLKIMPCSCLKSWMVSPLEKTHPDFYEGGGGHSPAAPPYPVAFLTPCASATRILCFVFRYVKLLAPSPVSCLSLKVSSERPSAGSPPNPELFPSYRWSHFLQICTCLLFCLLFGCPVWSMKARWSHSQVCPVPCCIWSHFRAAHGDFWLNEGMKEHLSQSQVRWPAPLTQTRPAGSCSREVGLLGPSGI